MKTLGAWLKTTIKTWIKFDDSQSRLIVMTIVFFCLGITLWLQPSRFHNTPSYANLLALIPTEGWGSIYLTTAALCTSCIVSYPLRWLTTVTHTVGITLLGVWWLAFWIRWLTDGGTTIVNVLSWGVFLYLMVRSAMKLDDQVSTPGGTP
jgi:uncharacterized membrane protein